MSPVKSIRIGKFTDLAKELSNKFTTEQEIQSKSQYQYLLSYLGKEGLKAQTLIIEDHYISQDFLKDYSLYYSGCFTRFDKYCKRIHFFSERISDEDFYDLSSPGLVEKQNILFKSEDYLGYVVAKRIPGCVFGYTLLRTWDEDEGHRKFWARKKYLVHLLGQEISLESLACCEQDATVSACASIAVWCMFQKAAEDYHVNLKSPSEITNDADTMSNDGSRLLPNYGLDVRQICTAITKNHLENEILTFDVDVNEEGQVKAGATTSKELIRHVYAYSGLGIPSIMLLYVPERADNDRWDYDLHAVAITGYRMETERKLKYDKNFLLISDKMSELYVHDDGYGPFAEIGLTDDLKVQTDWGKVNGRVVRHSYVTNMIFPLYPEIKVAYRTIEGKVDDLNTLLKKFLRRAGLDKHMIEWDIKLCTSESLKSEIRFDTRLNKTDKINILCKNFPKFIWKVSCLFEEDRLFDWILDATGISHDTLGVAVVKYHPGFYNNFVKSIPSVRDLTIHDVEFLNNPEVCYNKKYGRDHNFSM